MQNKIILFDIDHTLFNTEKYKEQAFTDLSHAFPGLDDHQVLKAAEEEYAKMREVDVFHPFRFAKRLLDRLRRKQNIGKIVAMLENKELLLSCVFPDVKSSLEKISEMGVRMGIFSTGDRELQMVKIDAIGHFFKEEDIHIYPLKDIEIPKVLEQYKGWEVYFVDDILRVLEEVHRVDKNVTTIWITRKDQPYYNGEDEVFAPYRQVVLLSEVVNIF